MYRRAVVFDDISLGSTVRVHIKSHPLRKRSYRGTYRGLEWHLPPGGKTVYMRVDGPGGQSWCFPACDVEFVESLVEQQA